MNDLVSVVIPVYNTEEYIEECVESLIKQSYKNIEIIIINDASTDDSDTVIKKLKKRYKNIKYIKLSQNLGQSGARNRGIEESSGKWIIFLDSDDTLYLDAIEKMILENKKGLVMTSFCRKINNVVKKVNFQIKSEVYSKKDFAKVIYTLIPLNWISCIGTKLYNLDIIKKNNIKFDDKKYKYNEDIAFVFDYLNYIDKINTTNEVTYCYLKRKGSTQNSIRNNPLATIIEARKKVRSFLEKYEVFEEKKEEYGMSLLEVYFSILINDFNSKEEFIKLSQQILKSDEYNNYVKNLKKCKNKKEWILLEFLKKKRMSVLYIYVRILKHIKLLLR